MSPSAHARAHKAHAQAHTHHDTQTPTHTDAQGHTVLGTHEFGFVTVLGHPIHSVLQLRLQISFRGDSSAFQES